MRHGVPPEDLNRAHDIVGSRWEHLRGGRVFITGGTGFVGKWLMETLLDANARLGLDCALVVLTRNPAAFQAESPELARADRVDIAEGDVRSLRQDLGSFSHVIHAATDVVAANTPIETFDTCVEGTRRVLDMAVRAKTGAMLLVSSGAVYGRQPPDLETLPESWLGAPATAKPSSAYGEGKRAAEWLANAYAAEHSIRIPTARCFAFVGPYLPLDKHFAIGNFLRDAMGQRPITIQGDGTPFRSYLHACDMAAWLWTILLEGRSQAAYNVGGREAISIAQLANRVVNVLGSTSSVRALKQAPPDAKPERYVPDVSLAQTEFQLPPAWSLDEAILRTARWYQRGVPHP